MTACYLINRTPTRVLGDRTPYEVLNHSKPFLNHLRVFGCLCYVLQPCELRNKLEARSTKALFIGYSTTQKGYKCYVPESRRVLISRDVKFVESRGYYEEKSWDKLKDLSQTPSNRADNLRRIMENLRISLLKDPEKVREVPTQAVEETLEDVGVTHPDHEGSNGNDVQPAHDQDEIQSEADAETQMETQSDGNEAEPQPIQPLRRSTRVKKLSKLLGKNTQVLLSSTPQAGPRPLGPRFKNAQDPQYRVPRYRFQEPPSAPRKDKLPIRRTFHISEYGRLPSTPTNKNRPIDDYIKGTKTLE